MVSPVKNEQGLFASAKNEQLQVSPKQIYIIRHAEKQINLENPVPPFGIDINGNQNLHSLVPKGWQRSGALIKLFDNITYLFSPLFDDLDCRRTFQTIIGLAEKLDKQIHTIVPVGQEEELVPVILNNYSDIVLISWEHNHIPKLAKLIPTVNSMDIPSMWPDDRFDMIWSFVRESDKLEYRFSQIPQMLLADDSDKLISI